MKNFQTILMVIFGVGGIIGVFVFSGMINVGKDSKNELSGNIVVWGTLESSDFNKAISSILPSISKNLSVFYVSKNKDNYQSELIDAFARGKGPDLFLITQDMIIQNKDFLYQIPYESYPEIDFRNKYIDGADIYLNDNGVIALPLLIDPLVMYYNNNKLANEGIVNPPLYWDELFNLNNSLTKKNDDGSIKDSMIALGLFDNINNSKEILSALFLQAGNSVLGLGRDGEFVSIFSGPSIVSPLNFFSEFSNKKLSAYSWSESLPNSRDLFTSDRLAMYLGFSSEIFEIEKINPNLSFNVTQIPQTRESKNKRTFGNIYAISISKNSKNISGAFSVAYALSSNVSINQLSKISSIPPATRTLLSVKPEEPYLNMFFNSAIISKAWLDPNPEETGKIFNELVNNVVLSGLNINDSVAKASSQISVLLNN